VQNFQPPKKNQREGKMFFIIDTRQFHLVDVAQDKAVLRKLDSLQASRLQEDLQDDQ
jgi:hypothetical protein